MSKNEIGPAVKRGRADSEPAHRYRRDIPGRSGEMALTCGTGGVYPGHHAQRSMWLITKSCPSLSADSEMAVLLDLGCDVPPLSVRSYPAA